MFVSESTIPYKLEEVIIFDYGRFYFFENFIISEINEGVLFDWDLATELIELATSYYGENPKIGYVSNRIHSYSLKPQDWLKFFSARHTLTSFAIVDPKSQSSTLLEKMFFKSLIQKFDNLNDATSWVQEITINSKSKDLIP